jgi:antirestriction protein ArdC
MKTNTQNQDSRLKNRTEQAGTDRGGKRGSVYDQITERIIALLQKGDIPWRKPWKVTTGLPRNFVTKRHYRGVNVLLLHAMHYESPFWLTFHQAQQLGGSVRKGERACPVVFGKRVKEKDEQTGEETAYTVLRLYNVFNTAQCDGLKNIPAPVVESPLSAPAKPEEIIAFMPQRPEIKQGMRKAFYSPGPDIVAMPDRARFETEAGYYATLFHELIHSTGHPLRLDRPTLMESQGFGSDPYCREELIAEMGAAFLCGQAGIAESTVENSAAYVQNWLQALQNDHKLIVQAAAQAQKAADFILGTKFEEAPAEQKETVAA